MAGKLTAVVGTMGCGKSERLIELFEKFLNEGKNVAVFKPIVDTRSGNLFAVSSRNGKRVPAFSINVIDDISMFIDDIDSFDVILIDEIQFFDDPYTVDDLVFLTLLGIDVYVFGLDVTSDDVTFGLVGDILAHADEVVKLKAKCARCGNEARISHYKGDEEKSGNVKVGDLDVYEPLCRECFYVEEQKITDLLEKDLMSSGFDAYPDVEKPLFFEFIGDGMHTIIGTTEKELDEVGYTIEDVNDISTPIGVQNLLKDLGYEE